MVMVYSRSYGHSNVKSGPYFVFSANDGKELVTVWPNYLSVSERSYLALLVKAGFRDFLLSRQFFIFLLSISQEQQLQPSRHTTSVQRL